MQKKDIIDQLFDLSGRVAVITGGAGLLGFQHAKAIAACGGTTTVTLLFLFNARATWADSRWFVMPTYASPPVSSTTAAAAALARSSTRQYAVSRMGWGLWAEGSGLGIAMLSPEP